MKTLSPEQIDQIKNDYPEHVAMSMLRPEKVEEGLAFIARHEGRGFTYQNVYWNKNGFSVYQKNGEERVFGNATVAFELTPLSAKDAEGDWREWLTGATLVETLK